MAGFSIERGPYVNATTLVGAMIDDMTDNGFTLISPSTFDGSTATAPYRVTLEASGTVDPLNDASEANKQPWRVCLDVQEDQTFFFYVGTPMTLPNDGSLTFYREVIQMSASSYQYAPSDVLGNVNFKMGTDSQYRTSNIGDPYINAAGIWTTRGWGSSGAQAVDKDEPKYGVINRRFRIPTDSDGALAPMRYRLSITDRGVWFGIYEDAISSSYGYNFNWVLVQRPVDRLTGDIIVDGKAPVWCVAYTSPNADFPTQTYIFQHVVRESDIVVPASGPAQATEALRRRADINQADSDALINIVNQVSLSEDGKYIVTFPARLNTTRYCYSYELDMIGITSADVVSQDINVPINVYGESSSRIYKAMHSTGVNNVGMRVLALVEGGGIDPTP